MAQSSRNLVRMFLLMIAWSSLIMDEGGGVKSRSQSQIFMVFPVSDLRPPWPLVYIKLPLYRYAIMDGVTVDYWNVNGLACELSIGK